MERAFIIKFRKILLSNWFYGIFLVLSLSYTLLMHQIKSFEPPNVTTNRFSGYITFKEERSDFISLELKGKVNLLILFKQPSSKIKKNLESIVVGSKVSLEGKIEKIEDTYSNFDTFSFAKKFARKHLFYQIEPDFFCLLQQDSFYYGTKEKIYHFFNSFSKTSAYLKTFLLGDTSGIFKEVKNAYQILGISHLFALSGMHISCFIGGIFRVLQFYLKKEKTSFFVSLLFLSLYLFLVRLSPSVIRASLFFLFFGFNRIYDLHIAPYQLLLFILSLLFFINPFIYQEISFLYSFTISASLLLFRKRLGTGSFFIRLLKVTSFSFFISLPITVATQYQVNFLSILWNLFYIPFVSFIIFPFSFLVLLFPFLESLFLMFIKLLETSAVFLKEISFLTFPFIHFSSFLFYVGIFCLFFLCFFKKSFFLLYFIVLFLFLFIAPLWKPDRIVMFDVGQGDAILFESGGKALLLDTGGREGEGVEQNASDLICNLKARGIKHLSIALSHGDKDHAGNVLSLFKEFRIDRIYRNLGSETEEEKQILKEAKKRKIPHQKMKEGDMFSLGNFTFLQINQSFSDENTSSSVYLVTLDQYAMLFMGDASIQTENVLIKKYRFPELLFLKVGHHGSLTSSSESFLDHLTVSSAWISSGRKNRFHHPNPSILSRFQKRKIPIFNTQKTGSVELTFPNLEMKTAR